MAIVWDNSNDRGVKTSGHNKPALLENGQTLLFTDTISIAGGTRGIIAPTDWLSLIPIWKVTLRRFSRN